MPILTICQTVRDSDNEPVESDHWDEETLHGAVNSLGSTRTSHVGGVEYSIAQYSPWSGVLTLTVQNAMEYRTGCREERVLYVSGVSRHSAHRLARLTRSEWQA